MVCSNRVEYNQTDHEGGIGMIAKIVGLLIAIAGQIYLPVFIRDLGFPDAAVGFSCAEETVNTEFAARWVKYDGDSVVILTGYGVAERFPVPIVLFVEEFSGDEESFAILVDSNLDGYVDLEYSDINKFIEDWGEGFCETLERIGRR